jgi:hypothetical protein
VQVGQQFVELVGGHLAPVQFQFLLKQHRHVRLL